MLTYLCNPADELGSGTGTTTNAAESAVWTTNAQPVISGPLGATGAAADTSAASAHSPATASAVCTVPAGSYFSTSTVLFTESGNQTCFSSWFCLSCSVSPIPENQLKTIVVLV